jgi:uncharacterized membrane protein (DUF2068 family)
VSGACTGEEPAAIAVPPGVLPGKRLRPRPHYELLTCGCFGHELVGLDAAELRAEDRLYALQAGGVRWHRCLRCDSWLPIAPPRDPTRDHPPERSEIELPLRGRPLRDKIVLRAIAVDRAFHFAILGLVAIALWVFAAHAHELRDTFFKVLSDLQGPVAASTQHPAGWAGKVHDLLSARVGTLHAVALAAAGYAVLEGVEAVGLWYQRRWAEYLTFLATTGLLPLEVYELSHRFSVLKIAGMVVNVAVVIYLLLAKRLFGLRGGGAAERAERERDLGWAALERNSAVPALVEAPGVEAPKPEAAR